MIFFNKISSLCSTQEGRHGDNNVHIWINGHTKGRPPLTQQLHCHNERIHWCRGNQTRRCPHWIPSPGPCLWIAGRECLLDDRRANRIFHTNHSHRFKHKNYEGKQGRCVHFEAHLHDDCTGEFYFIQFLLISSSSWPSFSIQFIDNIFHFPTHKSH